ncbi:hypothetical protein DFH09DRAFT_1309363 [Mycena vulgaris]|nr:hypothetical protein DFH09DRAFT_1309363 [Mycena vulgaris]
MADDCEDAPRSSPIPDSPSADTAPKPCHVVDFEPDDDEWEDEDTQLEGLGTTTHGSPNRTRPVIPIRKHRRIVRGANSHATMEARAKSSGSRKSFAADLAAWEVERKECVQELAEKHSMKVKEVRRWMLSTSVFKPTRKVSLYNAKIARIMAGLNEGRALGERYKLADVKRMVRHDPTMLDAFTEEEEAEMVEDLVEKQKTQFRGTRANNLAAGADTKRTVERMMLEITGLAERVGMIRFAMFTCGHIHDKTIPVTIQSWGALDFFREILKKDPDDVAALFELWAVSRERGDTGADTLIGMQQDCMNMITSGLRTVLGKTKVKMNFENYIKSIVEGKNVGLVRWPEDVEFKCMSKQSKIGPLRTHCDALKCGMVRWKVLSAGEKRRLVEQFKEMVEKGEAQAKVGKARGEGACQALSGVSRSRKRKTPQESEEEDDHHHAPPKPKASRTLRPRRKTSSAKQVEPREGEGDEDDDDDNANPSEDEEDSNNNTGAPCKAISEMTVQEKRARLMHLVAKSRKVSGEGERGARRLSKRTRDEEPVQPRKKVKRKANEGEGHASGKGSKRKRDAEEDEGGQKRKKKKTSKEVPTPTQAAPVKPRSKPPAAKFATSTTTGDLPVTTTDDVPARITTSGAPSTTSISNAPATTTTSAPVMTNTGDTPSITTTTTGNAPMTITTSSAPSTTSTGVSACGFLLLPNEEIGLSLIETRCHPHRVGAAARGHTQGVSGPHSAPVSTSTGDAPATKDAAGTLLGEVTNGTALKPAKCNTVKGRAGGPPGQKADYLKAGIREGITAKLVAITGQENAQMVYVWYEEDIIQKSGVILVGWTFPELVNPTELSTSLPALQELHEAIQSDKGKFVKLTAELLKTRKDEWQLDVAAGRIEKKGRAERSDKGKKCARKADDNDAGDDDTEEGHTGGDGNNDRPAPAPPVKRRRITAKKTPAPTPTDPIVEEPRTDAEDVTEVRPPARTKSACRADVATKSKAAPRMAAPKAHGPRQDDTTCAAIEKMKAQRLTAKNTIGSASEVHQPEDDDDDDAVPRPRKSFKSCTIITSEDEHDDDPDADEDDKSGVGGSGVGGADVSGAAGGVGEGGAISTGVAA